jgi:hypothetical protein
MNLKEAFDAGYHCLVVGRSRSALCRRDNLLKTLPNLSPVWAVHDAHGAWKSLLRLAGPETRQYTSHEVATASGVSLPTVSTWCLDGVIRASIKDPGGRGRGRDRVFSFEDVYIAAMVGSMRRRGVPPTPVYRMAEFLYSMVTEESKDAVGV